MICIQNMYNIKCEGQKDGFTLWHMSRSKSLKGQSLTYKSPSL